ncbi:JKAMP [Bugula neritina]|uniref:JKAMP n=1 Tax=Bugula neritina TaxID=10212 RepID=A0A7J7JDM1_BUGNE|nr:JKAMP [Bugula neritina]
MIILKETMTRQLKSCKWGYRANPLSVCEPCTSPLPLYDWMYLLFMVLISFVLHCIAIDINTNRKSSYSTVLMHTSAFLECSIAALCTLLLLSPTSELRLHSCGVTSIQDWYSVFYNPTLQGGTTLHCTQEVVYPLYTSVMIYFSLQIPAMIIFRPIFSNKRFTQRGVDSASPIYGALYFLPLLVLLQTVAGGIIYYSFPYLALILSVVSLTVHLSHFQDQNISALFSQSLCNARSFCILLLCFFLHGYGIFSLVISMMDISQHSIMAGCLLLLVPAPYLIYILTSKHTDPEKLDSHTVQ